MINSELQFTSKSEYVYQILRDRIMLGELEAGKRYKVVKIAEELGVSRTPVSDAIKVLASQGYVTLLPSVGFEIRQLTLNEVKGILLIRGALEELVIELAIDNATSKEIADLRNVLHRCVDAINVQDIKQYSKLNEKFHFSLYQLACLPNLMETLQTLWTHEGWFNEELKSNPENILTLVKDHYDILDIIELQEKQKIKEIVKNHINNCVDAITAPLSQAGLKES